MEFTPRPYQEKAIKDSLDFIQSSSERPSMVVSPVGSGKSIIIAKVADSLDKNIIILQPSIELLKQNFEKYISYGNYAEIYSASLNRKKYLKLLLQLLAV